MVTGQRDSVKLSESLKTVKSNHPFINIGMEEKNAEG